MENLVLGIGNEIKRDDAIGLIVTKKISEIMSEYDIDFKTLNSGKLLLLDEVRGYDNVIIIDSIKTQDGVPGILYNLTPDDIGNESGISLSHNVDMEILSGKYSFLEESLPKVEIIAIETKNPFEFGESLTSELEGKIPEIVENIEQIIRDKWGFN